MSKIEERIDKIWGNLVNTGSDIGNLKNLRKRSIQLVRRDTDLRAILSSPAREIEEKTEEFLHSKNKNGTNFISGISMCLYLPDFKGSGEYKLKLIGGNRSRNLDLKVDGNTLFDVASITKLYTLLLLFKLEEEGLIDLNTKVSDINPDFQNLEDFTLNDLVRLHGKLWTNGNITMASSMEEAYQILKTLYLKSNTREENKYTDFGAIVIGDTISKVVSEKLGKEMSFNDVMNEYLLEPLNLNNTMFNPKSNNISGNGNDLGLVHDPKARILGGALGHAGIFTTSDDLALLASNIYSVKYINKSHIARLGEITFPNSEQSNRGNLGIYVKHPLGYSKTFTPKEFSTGSFSHQGWTGSVAAFDPNNNIFNSILVNAIYEGDDVENDKPIGFGDAFEQYQMSIAGDIMLTYVVEQYYKRYCNQRENISDTRFIK